MNTARPSPPSAGRMLIVGNPAEEHVGSHFRHAAVSLGWDATVCDVGAAFRRGSLWQAIAWRLLRRPAHLGRFSRQVVQIGDTMQPQVLLATGLAPVRPRELRWIAARGTILVNFLTDDPWNRVHRASWFLRALRYYDLVVSPRRAVVAELQEHGCRAVQFLPFAYAPEVHFPAPPATSGDDVSDVVFIGGADADRVPVIRALRGAGFNVVVYGDYWDRHPDLRVCWRGMADLATVRAVTREARVVLGMVRHANRDGNTMRSFEVPAMRGCMLAEDTAEHREIFGSPGTAVRYFRTIDDLLRETRWLLDHPDERERLATAAHALVTGAGHRYADRLQQILAWIGCETNVAAGGLATGLEANPFRVVAGPPAVARQNLIE